VRSPIVVYDERAEKDASSSNSYIRVDIVVGSSLGGFIILVLISIVRTNYIFNIFKNYIL